MLNTHRWWGHKFFSRLGNAPMASAVAATVYHLHDTFTDSNGTDLDTHVSEVGGWTELDTGGLLDIQSNMAELTGNNDYADPVFFAGPFARSAGQELLFNIEPGQTNSQLAIGLWSGIDLNPSTGDREHLMWFFGNGSIYCRETGAEGAAGAYTTDKRECKIVVLPTGAEYWYNGIKIAELAVNSGDPLYVGISVLTGVWKFDDLSFSIT